MKEGDIPKYRHSTGVTEIWKGQYNGDVVALKVLRIPRDDPQMQGIKSVSTSRGPLVAGLFVVVLIDDVAVLQGGSVNDAAQARKYPPSLRGVHDGLRLLPGISLVRERKHHRLFEGETGSRYQSLRLGQYTRANSTLLTLTCPHEQLLGVIRGLLFLHKSRLVHGALRPVCRVSFLLTRLNAVDRVMY